ncbi:MAG TPA: hypothetical protein VH678_09760 [Xanthobacteraceae bacterium]|jgi:hypothetical protein
MFRVVCIAALLSLLGPHAKSQPIFEQAPQSTQQQANPEQRGTEQAPFIIRMAPAQETPDKSRPPAGTEKGEGTESTWRGLFKEWGLSDKIAAVVGLVALFQFLALLAAVRAISRSSRRQLRAYVSMGTASARLVNDPNGEPILEGYVKLKNFGSTPAFQYTSYAMIKVANVNAAPFDETSVSAGRGLLGPGAETDLQVYWRVSDGDLAAIRAGAKRIFVWGEAHYADVYGKNRYFKFYNVNAPEELAGLGWPLLAADKAAEAN